MEGKLHSEHNGRGRIVRLRQQAPEPTKSPTPLTPLTRRYVALSPCPRKTYLSDDETIAALQSLPLLHLATVLEESCSARVYFRASGGLARLAEATRAASLVTTVAVDVHRAGHCADPPTENVSGKIPSTPATAAAATAELTRSHKPPEANGGGVSEAAPLNKEGTGDGALYEHGEKSGLTAADARNLTTRFELMLRALAAALLGGERLAQQDVLKSGLLDGPCGKALLMVSDEDYEKGSAVIGRTVDVAGAAATVLSRVVDDPHIRAHISRYSEVPDLRAPRNSPLLLPLLSPDRSYPRLRAFLML